MKKIVIMIVFLIICTVTYLFWFYMLREEWQENEILNIACVGTYLPIRLSDPQPIGYTISLFEDGSMQMATGAHKCGVWRNSLRLGALVNKSRGELNERGYWQKIWRGSVQLEVTVWEERAQLSEEDFKRVKELISDVDEHDLSSRFILALTDEFIVNTRQTRYYGQRAGGDKRVIALYDELWRLIPLYFD